MEHEQSLWEKLKRDGFKCKTFTSKPTRFERFKSIFGVEPQLVTKTNTDWLVKTVNGKSIDVCAVDIWYTNVRVDGKVIFDARRFDDQDLFEAIEKATTSN